MPPSVTNLVPGVTTGNQPRGRKVAITSASSTPASATSSPSSKEIIRSKARMSSVRVPTALSP